MMEKGTYSDARCYCCKPEDQMNKRDTDRHLRYVRITKIKAFIKNHIERPVEPAEIDSVERLSAKTLHLLAAALDEAGVQ